VLRPANFSNRWLEKFALVVFYKKLSHIPKVLRGIAQRIRKCLLQFFGQPLNDAYLLHLHRFCLHDQFFFGFDFILFNAQIADDKLLTFRRIFAHVVSQNAVYTGVVV